MPRQKRFHAKQRKDGRYCYKYHGKQFLSYDDDDAWAQREAYRRMVEAGETAQPSGPTVAEYAAGWLPRAKAGVADQTYTEAACLLEKLTRQIGSLRFPDVKPSDVKDVYAKAFKGLSDSYIKSGAQLYRALFAAAVDDGLCKSNPAKADSAKPHKGTTETKTRAITAQERQWIETLCTDHRAHPAVMAMLYAGIRPQEAKALNIDTAVDFSANMIHVSESVHLDGANRYRITDTMKTPFSTRDVPLLPPLREALLKKPERESARIALLEENRKKRGLPPSTRRKSWKKTKAAEDVKKYGMLVSSADGRPVSVQAWRSVWESYVFEMETAINGCQEQWYGKKREHQGRQLPPFVHFTVLPYDLRHSFCKMCRDNGVEINTCIHWMGHADAKMILKIYDEYTPERGKKEAERLKQSLLSMQNGMQK